MAKRADTSAAAGAPAKTVPSRHRLPFAVWFRRFGWRHVVGILGALFALFPVAWVVSAAFNPLGQLSTNTSIIPEGVTLQNFRDLFNNETLPFGRFLWNSFLIALIASSLQLVMSAMAAFSFSRLRWKGRRTGLLVILLVQMFPQFLAFIALFLMLDRIGDVLGDATMAPAILVWGFAGFATAFFGYRIIRRGPTKFARGVAYFMIGVGALLMILAVLNVGEDTTLIPAVGLNTHAGIILVYLGGSIGVNTWLIKGFMDSLPFSLDESATVDGAGQWDIFTRIILPLSRPVLAVIFVITFVFIYNEYILASIILRETDQLTYPLGLQLLSTGQYSAKWGEIAAGAIIGAAPIVVVMLAAQDQLVGGLTAGSVKG
ncbi:MAG TPA: ABC transporter permease subunit [Acidimicrobiia bacterium]|jgi:arabinogalactan oligomer/maltooligosaccharide transport system permease protein|nr:ABC transporter permease subunit [Acidimicrobiia bacterium]